MAHPPSSATSSRRRSRAAHPSPSTAPYGPEDFPGCEPFHLPAVDLEGYDGRLEFWDGRTQTAWRVCEPTSTFHEVPSRMLPQVAREFAHLRGSPIKCYGSADLWIAARSDDPRRLVQADEMLYLHPGRSQPHGSAIEAGTDPLPEVVLEVDHTTDVRRRKLSLYEEGGFAEVWVLVTRRPRSRSRSGWPRVTIHVLDGGAYRVAPQSAAIPGWKSEEICRALTEDPWSESTRAALERVALAMGAREGTTPEDDPHSRSLIRRGRVEGQREGYTEGRRDGEARGRREERAAMVLAMLRARGIEVSPELEEDLEALAGDVPAVELMTTVQTCTDEADFLRRVRESLR